MKIKDGFVIRNVADTFVVVPVGDKLVDFSAMMTLNETGAFLWNCLAENITKELFDYAVKTVQQEVAHYKAGLE